MAISDVADEYFTYESRLASFQTAQQLSKRRGSSANSKAPKALKWPHKFLPPEELARAGFFHYPTQNSPDNAACFLCHRSLDGWEKGDDPLVEHLKHSPGCGWAIVATIEKQDGNFSLEYPSSTRMIEARKATFANKWPHENKKGWKCKTKQMVDAGWKYTPSPEYDDMATCTYCQLALDGWEPSDKPLDEHFKRSPECPFFALINAHKQSPAAKRTKVKKDRTSKVSRLSTQSAFTVASDTASVIDLPAEEGDSILTTATNATATQGGKRMGKGKKATAGKGKKTRAKQSTAVEVALPPEPEDDDFEVKVDLTPKLIRGRKRKTEETTDSDDTAQVEVPPPKRRVTRSRASVAGETLLGANENSLAGEASSENPRKKGRQSTRKASAASVASLRGPVPDDDELDAALEADLDRRLTDDEGMPSRAKKTTRLSKIGKVGHAMFGIESMKIDEAAIEAELEAIENESKPLPKTKGTRAKQPRKVSAKQQAAAARKAAEDTAAAQKGTKDVDEASQPIASEPEHSLAIHHSSPVVLPKRQRASSRKPSRQVVGRRTRGSALSADEGNTSRSGDEGILLEEDDSGNETDASMASQSTVVTAGRTRREGELKEKGGRRTANRNIEEIAHNPESAETEQAGQSEDSSMAEDTFYTPAPEMQTPPVEELAPSIPIVKATKSRGRPPKKAPASATAIQQAASEMDYVVTETAPILPNNITVKATVSVPPPRSHTPPAKEKTPSQSPQSSDAENRPPSSKPPVSIKKASTPRSTTTRVPLAASTPVMSPSKLNIIAGLQSRNPWTTVDLDAIFLKSPGLEYGPGKGLLDDAVDKVKHGDLTSPEKRMSVEEWIHHNAEIAEDKLRTECERMVGRFELEGTRAMRALEGLTCVD